MEESMKNQITVKQSSSTLTPKGAKSEIITVCSGKPSRPKHVSLSDVINFIEKIISQFFCNYKKCITFALSLRRTNKQANNVTAFFIGTNNGYLSSNGCCTLKSVIVLLKAEVDSFFNLKNSFMRRTMKNDRAVNKSSAESRVTREKCCKIEVKQGKPSRPKHVSLSDVINFIENANKMEFSIINSTLKEAAVWNG
ncbi:MAG: hypothetical protein LBP85_01905 [Prevotellaceae bacterium]|jgi:hypothetical protein|nr:hypothetical protein [Prevotellaceae bacterium]